MPEEPAEHSGDPTPPEEQNAAELDTSKSLLERARTNDAEAWRRIVALYQPLVRLWCGRAWHDADGHSPGQVARAPPAQAGAGRIAGIALLSPSLIPAAPSGWGSSSPPRGREPVQAGGQSAVFRRSDRAVSSPHVRSVP